MGGLECLSIWLGLKLDRFMCLAGEWLLGCIFLVLTVWCFDNGQASFDQVFDVQAGVLSIGKGLDRGWFRLELGLSGHCLACMVMRFCLL